VGTGLLPWLYGAALNVLRNDARGIRRRERAFARMARQADEPDFADDVAGRLDDERRMRQVLERVSTLPGHERDVFELCVWQGLSYPEAAVALDVPIGTVRSRLSRARARLRLPARGKGGRT
jgi:RNA polymerase sigma-70 factor (ECF subfamily)